MCRNKFRYETFFYRRIFLTRVINKETLSEYVLIMEDQDKFIGYATIDRHSEKEEGVSRMNWDAPSHSLYKFA